MRRRRVILGLAVAAVALVLFVVTPVLSPWPGSPRPEAVAQADRAPRVAVPIGPLGGLAFTATLGAGWGGATRKGRRRHRAQLRERSRATE